MQGLSRAGPAWSSSRTARKGNTAISSSSPTLATPASRLKDSHRAQFPPRPVPPQPAAGLEHKRQCPLHQAACPTVGPHVYLVSQSIDALY